MSFKLFTAIAACNGWTLHHINITTIFLHTYLKESIYIHLLEGLQQAGKYALLIKTLYSLKQSPWEWYMLVHDFLLFISFKCTHANHSVFIKYGIAILLYIDDILILSNSNNLINNFLKQLEKLFKYTNNSKVSVYLGIDMLC
jgi:hypothetical protein